MPGMDGFELVREVHSARPQLPIILITGYPDRLTRLPALGRKQAAPVHQTLPGTRASRSGERSAAERPEVRVAPEVQRARRDQAFRRRAFGRTIPATRMLARSGMASIEKGRDDAQS